jgi:hypothetical protein
MLVLAVVFGALEGSHGGAAAAKENQMNLAFVLLPHARLPKGEEIARAFSTFAGQGQSLHVKGTKVDEAKKIAVLELEFRPSGTAFVAMMPMAVPKGEAEAAAQFSVSAFGTGWKLAAHAAHLVVSLRDNNSASAPETLSRFTSLLAAVTKASGAVGV